VCLMDDYQRRRIDCLLLFLLLRLRRQRQQRPGTGSPTCGGGRPGRPRAETKIPMRMVERMILSRRTTERATTARDGLTRSRDRAGRRLAEAGGSTSTSRDSIEKKQKNFGHHS
jgi:hypothetical protein